MFTVNIYIYITIILGDEGTCLGSLEGGLQIHIEAQQILWPFNAVNHLSPSSCHPIKPLGAYLHHTIVKCMTSHVLLNGLLSMCCKKILPQHKLNIVYFIHWMIYEQHAF